MKTKWLWIGVGLLLLLMAGWVLDSWRNKTESGWWLRRKPESSPAINSPLPADAQGRRPNRPIREKSPYLLQHAYNPVDWYPWGEEAFAKAKREDKPVFLSVGYSTCYWCHVMEKESFDNPEVARDIFEYVLRDVRDPQGELYSAEDAGEVGKEGEFYVWKPEEIENVLGAEEARLFNRFYGVTSGGNFENGARILSVESSLEKLAQQEKLSVEETRQQLEATRQKLLAARNLRQRPHRDDKILADWNGLMIGALAYGARVFDEPRYAQAARDAAAFLLDHLTVHPEQAAHPSTELRVSGASKEGRLLHRYRDGEASIPAFLDDYAFVSRGLLDLYEATFEVRWLAEAKRLTQEMVTLFWDEKAGGFFLSGGHNERLVAQTKELYNGALPSGNSVAALSLVRLGQLTMDRSFQANAERMFDLFSGQVAQASHAFPQFLIALDFWLWPSQKIVIAGDPGDPQTRRMIRAVHERFLPRAVLALHPEDTVASQVEVLVPFSERAAAPGRQADGLRLPELCLQSADHRCGEDGLPLG